jgi:thioredoxin reductase (NADPH)
MYLSKFAKQVTILIRKPDLSATMSQYLIDQIAATPNIEVRPYSQITEAHGDEVLQQLTVEDVRSHEVVTEDARAVFIFIGAKPYTEWLPEGVIKDEKGFVRTGKEITQEPVWQTHWKETREPFLLETSVPGIFAAGDVRSGAMNRVASAVGEGAMSISLVHRYLADA